MVLQHDGSFNGIVQRIEDLGWEVDTETYRKLDSGGEQIRTTDGVVINWWSSTGTVQVQGRDEGASKLRGALDGDSKQKQRGLPW